MGHRGEREGGPSVRDPRAKGDRVRASALHAVDHFERVFGGATAFSDCGRFYAGEGVTEWWRGGGYRYEVGTG